MLLCQGEFKCSLIPRMDPLVGKWQNAKKTKRHHGSLPTQLNKYALTFVFRIEFETEVFLQKSYINLLPQHDSQVSRYELTSSKVFNKLVEFKLMCLIDYSETLRERSVEMGKYRVLPMQLSKVPFQESKHLPVLISIEFNLPFQMLSRAIKRLQSRLWMHWLHPS